MRNRLILNLLLLLTVVKSEATSLAQQMQELNQRIVINDSNLWQRMRDGFGLDHSETKEVKYWEKRYGSQKYFAIIMKNAAPYLYFVMTEMERRGIPSELALIPIVESTYNPNAVSPAAISTGMWQFVSSSGKRFGLIQNKDLDERKDIVKSTRAAINYLVYLHDLFGSWELAIAAYNLGEGNINNAVNQANSKDFYDLDVRDITRQYVPKVIALANIIQNPHKFGIKLTDAPNQPYFAITNPGVPTIVTNFMSAHNLSTAQNKQLNPQYNSVDYKVLASQRLLLPVSNMPNLPVPVTTPDNLAKTDTKTPTSRAVIAADNLKQPNAASTNKDASSDVIADIATLSETGSPNTTKAIVANNNSNPAAKPPITTTDSVNQKVVINDLLDTDSPKTTTKFVNYTVASGDTLYSISHRFAVSIDDIKSDNQLIDNNVKLNQKLVIRSNS